MSEHRDRRIPNEQEQAPTHAPPRGPAPHVADTPVGERQGLFAPSLRPHRGDHESILDRNASLAVMLVFGSAILFGEWFTFVRFELICSDGGDIVGTPLADLCGPGRQHPQPQMYLPVLGAVAVLVGIVMSRAQHNYRGFLIAAGLGVSAGLALWVLYGFSGADSGLLS